MLALVAEDRSPSTASSAVAAVVENRSKVRGRPGAVDVHRVRGVDGFEAVVKSAAARPHFGEHGVALEGGLAVHGLE